MITHTLKGPLDIREILKWKRAGMIKAAPVRGLLHAYVAHNLTEIPHGTGNRARRRRLALEAARESGQRMSDIIARPFRPLTSEEKAIASGATELCAFYDRPNCYSGD